MTFKIVNPSHNHLYYIIHHFTKNNCDTFKHSYRSFCKSQSWIVFTQIFGRIFNC